MGYVALKLLRGVEGEKKCLDLMKVDTWWAQHGHTRHSHTRAHTQIELAACQVPPEHSDCHRLYPRASYFKSISSLGGVAKCARGQLFFFFFLHVCAWVCACVVFACVCLCVLDGQPHESQRQSGSLDLNCETPFSCFNNNYIKHWWKY